MKARCGTEPSGLLGKATRHYREGGPVRVLRIAARKVARTLFFANSAVWYRLECASLGEPQPASRPCAAGKLAIGFEPRESFECWARGNAPRFPYIFDEREASQDRGNDVSYYTVREESRIVAFVQVGRGRVFVRDFASHIRLPDGTAFIQQIFCDPTRRRLGYAALLLQCAVAELRKRSVGQVFCHIPGWNAPSIALHRRAGFAPIGRVTYVRAMGIPLFSRHPERLVRSGDRSAV